MVEAQLWGVAGEVVGDMTLGSHLLVAKALVRAPTETEVRGRLERLGRWFAAEAVVDADG